MGCKIFFHINKKLGGGYMNLGKTINNCRKSKNSFFNLKKGWVNMDILKPNIVFCLDMRERKKYFWEKEKIKWSNYYEDIYILERKYDFLSPYVIIDFLKVNQFDMGYVMRLADL